MLYHPELIVYLWLLPVFVFIILPALFKTGCVLYRQTSRSQAVLPVELAENNNIIQTQERRKHPRADVSGSLAFVGGRCKSCAVIVENISKFGICLKNLPKEILNEAEKFKVIVNTQAGNFEMQINPKWNTRRESGHRIGAEIENSPI